MKSLDQARELAQTMVAIGQGAGRKVVAVLSDMNQPLGRTIGNALEVREAIDTLQGKGPKDLEELSVLLAAHMVHIGGLVGTLEEALLKLKNCCNREQVSRPSRGWLKLRVGTWTMPGPITDCPGSRNCRCYHSPRGIYQCHRRPGRGKNRYAAGSRPGTAGRPNIARSRSGTAQESGGQSRAQRCSSYHLRQKQKPVGPGCCRNQASFYPDRDSAPAGAVDF